MGLGIQLQRLWRMRRWVAGCALLATFVAVWSVARIGLLPPRLEPRALKMSSASTQVLIDSPQSALVDDRYDTYDFEALTNRAVLVGNVVASLPIRRAIAAQAGVRADDLQVVPPLTLKQPRVLAIDGNERHATDLLKLNDQYRLFVRANPTVPMLQIYAQGPSNSVTAKLADAAVAAMQKYLDALARAQQTPSANRIKLTQLGRAHGSTINGGIQLRIAALAFVLTFGAAVASIAFFRRLREGWRLESLAVRSAGG
jgi:hypothetical protein